MRVIYRQMLAALMMGFVLPWIILGIVLSCMEYEEPRENPTSGEDYEVQGTEPNPEPEIKLQVVNGDEIWDMDLEEYISGVVLAEMPAEFEPEALKAQAVVARTYALRRMELGNKHDNGDVCTDPNCCQGYRSPEDYISRGGSEESVSKIQEAAKATAGQVLTYDGNLIEATYFSCSGGQTEDALAVWGADIPYLQSTSSPGEEGAAHYSDTVTMTPEEFRDRMGEALSGDPASWFGRVSYTDGGGVDTIRIGEKTYKGTEVRSLLSLRSTDFTIRYTGKDIEIVTHGFGHRVGMSQYGADAMAVAGSSYAEILAHYYQGTALVDYPSMRN